MKWLGWMSSSPVNFKENKDMYAGCCLIGHMLSLATRLAYSSLLKSNNFLSQLMSYFMCIFLNNFLGL